MRLSAHPYLSMSWLVISMCLKLFRASHLLHQGSEQMSGVQEPRVMVRVTLPQEHMCSCYVLNNNPHPHLSEQFQI